MIGQVLHLHHCSTIHLTNKGIGIGCDWASFTVILHDCSTIHLTNKGIGIGCDWASLTVILHHCSTIHFVVHCRIWL